MVGGKETGEVCVGEDGGAHDREVGPVQKEGFILWEDTGRERTWLEIQEDSGLERREGQSVYVCSAFLVVREPSTGERALMDEKGLEQTGPGTATVIACHPEGPVIMLE